MLRARRGARLTAITSGGAIPDTADYEVVLEPQAQRVGSVHEDFAVESMAGDIFQLGNTSYRILRVERGKVRVEDAQGAPPTIPFWLGEAPGRSDELSFAVSRLREEISAQLENGAAPAENWLRDDIGLRESAARQIVDYLGGAKAAFGMLPTQSELAMERFFDESGGTQLVIHSPFGSRLNRAWGLALRKRFCRTFNFELQAAATEDAIILSLSTSHSFPLDEVTPLPALQLRAPRADPGAARCADVRRALALERGDRARPAAFRRRRESAAAVAAHEVRGPACRGLSRSGRLPGEHRRRTPDSRSSAGRADPARLPARGHGHRRTGSVAAPARRR